MSDKVQPTPPLQETERDRWNYDVGVERGYEMRTQDDDRVGDLMDRIRATLREFVAELDAELAGDR